MSRNKEAINLSWLVEKWTIWDNSYLKNIWLNLDTLDLIRINDNMDNNDDIEESYIDIENNMDEFVCMPGREAVNKKLAREVFMDYLGSVDRDRLFENYNEYSADEEFLDLIYELGLENKLQEFREKIAGAILLNWANEEDIKVNKDMVVIDLYNRD
ncbi:acyl carrier protein [Anaerococcus vaginalis]|uniref:acyl carrier protein n=1 Tax=Anaerococcus vaginalis TaxID=33037 RepID=UPI002913A280|nr:acyl carrier protein [Anaerococcus vaginalis]MDU5251656.1 acyl carrier protein [Anaerococcus vaginalis]MDU6781006.1 acyl carrier protein [Anaerococcus vaginalis]